MLMAQVLGRRAACIGPWHETNSAYAMVGASIGASCVLAGKVPGHRSTALLVACFELHTHRPIRMRSLPLMRPATGLSALLMRRAG